MVGFIVIIKGPDAALSLEILKCVKCKQLARDPKQSSCGHLYCNSCIDELFKPAPSRSPLVPDGGNRIREVSCLDQECDQLIEENEFHPDKAAKRDILRIEVYCNNKKYGCNWEGILRNLEEHLPNCEFRPFPCPNKCGIQQPKNQMETHLISCIHRKVECPYCGEEFTYEQLENHKTECPRCPVSCPDCEEKLLKDELEHHHRQCPNPRQECPFVVIGCFIRLKEEEIDEHERQALPKHSKLVFGRIDILRHQNEMIKDLESVVSLTIDNGKIENLTQFCIDTLKNFDDITNTLRDLERRKVNPVTETVVQEAKEKIKLYGLKEQTLRGIIVTLQRELERAKQLQQDTGQVRSDMERRMLTLLRKVTEAEGNLQRKEAIIELKKKQITEFEETTFDGTFYWKITDIQNKLQEAKRNPSNIILSNFFFTGLYGYKMRGKIYLNGDGTGKGTHVSLFFVLCKGKYDALLRFPFKQKVTMEIINHARPEASITSSFSPDSGSSSFRKPIAEMNVASGWPKFAEQSKVFLEDSPFIKDNTLFVKIAVDCSGL